MAGTSSIETSGLQALNIEKRLEKEPKKNELGRDAFLKLMITQMKNQDPLDPQSNSEFVAQLAQFSSVEGLDRLNKSVESMVSGFQSNQALQASALVGRSVKVPSETSYLVSGSAIAGSIVLPQSTSGLELNVYNSSNELVWSRELGSQKAGSIDFIWEGADKNGETLASGTYRFEALAKVDGKSSKAATTLSANVNSVTLGKDSNMTLNLAGVGPVKLSSVTEIL